MWRLVMVAALLFPVGLLVAVPLVILPRDQAAAQPQCHMLLVYTLDTTFHDRDLASPLSVVTLGLSPTQATSVLTTASAMLMDTRNGYIYGVAEASAKKEGLATAWNTGSAIDASRRQTETQAFQKLVGDVETMWKGVVRELGRERHSGLR